MEAGVNNDLVLVRVSEDADPCVNCHFGYENPESEECPRIDFSKAFVCKLEIDHHIGWQWERRPE